MNAPFDGAALTRPVLFNCHVMDYIMHFLTVVEALRLRYVCRTWDSWVSPILRRGAFDALVALGNRSDVEQFALSTPTEHIQRNTFMAHSFLHGDARTAMNILRRMPFNLPVVTRGIVDGEPKARASFVSPVVALLSCVNDHYTARNPDKTHWFIVQRLHPGGSFSNDLVKRFSSLGARPELYRRFLARGTGSSVPMTELADALNKREFASRWYRNALHGLRVFRREGWLPPGLPLIEYALVNVVQVARWSKVRRLVDVLLHEFHVDINAAKLTSGVTALHGACGLGAAISPTKIVMLVKRGARWDVRTTASVGEWRAGITPLEVLEAYVSEPSRIQGDQVPWSQLNELLTDAQRGYAYEDVHEDVSDVGEDDAAVLPD